MTEIMLTEAEKTWLQENNSQDIPYRIPHTVNDKTTIRKAAP